MSKAVNSPTARLLQSSRLFSLPRPLPVPDLSATGSGIYKASDTATTPYPTHQAIVTPASSLHRGDWGLKRSLPSKRLRGTEPTVRIRAQDTWEHVTTFESAGDHVRTLQKWGEMGIPMMVNRHGQQRSYTGSSKPESVYDDAHDVTDKRTAIADRSIGRWKYDGPWLSGMGEGEFQQWLLRQVSTRHTEWLDFLRQDVADHRIRKATAEARDAGTPLSVDDLEQLRATSRPTNQELVDVQKQLRDDHALHRLNSELTALITRFLDLPSIALEESDAKASRFRSDAALLAGIPAEKGPPSTHPGAGISHVRTNAIMENHPIHGPQAERSPVQARVVRPHVTAGMATEHFAKLGVAGVVANDGVSGTGIGQDASRHRRVQDVAHSMDPSIVGGGKVWVQPRSAHMDEKGRIFLKLARADREAVAVKTGEVEEIHELKRQGSVSAAVAREGRREYPRYGSALPDRRKMFEQQQGAEAARAGPARQRPSVEGFDDEISGSGSGQATGVADILRRGIS